MLLSPSPTWLAATALLLFPTEDARSFRVVDVVSPAAEGSDAAQLFQSHDGGVWLVWLEGKETPETTLRLSRWTGEGFGPPSIAARGDDIVVTAVDPPALAVARDGTIAVAWLTENGGEGHARDARIAVTRDQGQTWSAPVHLHEDRSPSEHGFVSLQPLDSGGFLALWLDGRQTLAPQSATPAHAAGSGEHATAPHAASDDHGGGHGPPRFGPTELWSRQVRPDGTLGPEQRVDERACDCCTTDMVAIGAGRLLAAWRDRGDDEVRDIRFARFHAGSWSASQPVHADGWLIPGCPLNGPSLASDAGRTACAWFAGGDANGVFLALLEPGAQAFGPPLRLDEGGAVGKPASVFLPDGSLAVVFLAHDEEGDAWRAVRVGREGQKSASTLIAYTGSSMSMLSGIPGLVSLPDSLLVTWLEPDAPNPVRVARLLPSD